MKQRRALVLCSGGVDSTTCLALAIERFGAAQVVALSIGYGQKHEKELVAAQQILDYYGVVGYTMDVGDIFQYSQSTLLSQSDRDVPKGAYASQQRENGVVSTYVPFRNGLFLSVAASMALSLDCGYIYYGAHRDDAAGQAYPDCSSTFYEYMKRAIYEGSGQVIAVEAPFIHSNKAAVVKEGLRLHVPYELTWSCYEGKDKPCGHCGTCLDRAAAFYANGVADPALVEDSLYT